MLRHPRRGQARTARGRISPYAATTSTSSGVANSAARADSSLQRGWLADRAGRAPAQSVLTGEAATRRPRPCGRSGCVSTSGIVKPASMDGAQRMHRERRRAGEADAKAARGRGAQLASFCFLRSLASRRARLRARGSSTKTLPSRWSISCWMHTASRPSVVSSKVSPRASWARTVIRGGADDLVVVPGDGQAAFLALGLAFGGDELGVDEDLEVDPWCRRCR